MTYELGKMADKSVKEMPLGFIVACQECIIYFWEYYDDQNPITGFIIGFYN